MLLTSLVKGLALLRRRKSLALLIYAIGLVVAALIAVPVYATLDIVVGETGFSSDLVRQFDIVLWADIVDHGGAGFGSALRLLVWVVPLLLVWNVASHVGLIFALGEEGDRSFWLGLERFTLKGVILAIPFLLLSLVGIFLIWSIGAGVADPMGEIGKYRTYVITLPIITILFLALIDLTHDYARMHLVLRERGALASFRRGLKWPFQHKAAFIVYGLWLIPVLVIWFVPFVIDFAIDETNAVAMVGVFGMQQAVLLLRSALTVGWLGSETVLFEEFEDPAEPEDLESENELEAEPPT